MGFIWILIIMAMGLFSRSNLVVMAGAILLILRLLHFEKVIHLLAERGINFGLLFLIVTVLIPLATDQVSWPDLKEMMISPAGVLALVGGLLATKLNGMGIDLLKMEPQLVIGMIIGSIIGIVFWGGVPVGPLMAGGLTALLIKLFGMLF